MKNLKKIVFLCIGILLMNYQAWVWAQITPKREFRGVWVSTVLNLDFPSKNTTTETQKQEFIRLLDAHQKQGINAVLVQVRPAGDAFYASMAHPWSEWLTGKQGKIPSPFYDPLAFMVEETHRRGMEFHAWFNPFRAVFNVENSSISSEHITIQKPDWFVVYEKQKIFNPALPEVRQYIIATISEVATHYDIDGVHLDDYFYPYPTKGDFADSLSYIQYGKKFSSKGDWRRNNINLFMDSLQQQLKKIKPYLKIGVSPFGVWRNQSQDTLGSATQAGFTAYDHLYADVRLWLEKGWIDYVSPQIYFSIGNDKVDYKTALAWWERNTFDRHLYVGLAAYKIQNNADSRWSDPSQMPNQIRIYQQSKAEGGIFFRSQFLIKNTGGIADSLQSHLYTLPKLPPTMPWLDAKPPQSPQNLNITACPQGIILFWDKDQTIQVMDKTAYYMVYRFEEGEIPIFDTLEKALVRIQDAFFIDTTAQVGKKYIYFVFAYDRLHNESAPSRTYWFHFKKKYTKQPKNSQWQQFMN